MGLLGRIAGAVKWLVSAPFVAVNYVLDGLANLASDTRETVEVALKIKKKKPPTEKIKAALRKQWLELEPGETEIAGVEWEGEIYYETPK